MPIEIKEIVIRAEITQSDSSSETVPSNHFKQDHKSLFTEDSVEMIREICQQELEKQERFKNSHNRSSRHTR